MRFTFTSPTVNGVIASDTERCLLTSSGSKSDTVVPSSILPCRGIAPDCVKRASARVVLPAPLCPTRATLRIRDGGWLGTVLHLPGSIGDSPGRPAPEPTGKSHNRQEIGA